MSMHDHTLLADWQIDYIAAGLVSINRTFEQMFAAAREGFYEPDLIDDGNNPAAMAQIFDWYVTHEIWNTALALGLTDVDKEEHNAAICEQKVNANGYDQYFSYEIAREGEDILSAFAALVSVEVAVYDNNDMTLINGKHCHIDDFNAIFSHRVRFPFPKES